jgi:quercetin dioxygenase-like cupin family protein
MTVVQPGQGRALTPDMTLKVATGDLALESLSVVEGVIAAGQYIGPHTHSREDEVTVVLDGQIVALLDDTVLEVSAGSMLVKPAGVMHAFGNRGPGPARVYELHAPGGLEEFYAAMYLNFSDPMLSEEQKHHAFLASCEEFGLVHHIELRDEVRVRLGL